MVGAGGIVVVPLWIVTVVSTETTAFSSLALWLSYWPFPKTYPP